MTAQLVVPVLFQFFISPFHIAGIFLTAEGSTAGAGGSTRSSQVLLSAIQHGYVSTTALRMARVFPSFGLGGCVNSYCRKMHYS
mmetsp:Transcript_9977/g.18625  ORF Transcript_9977/g.18625 Transcript_9977/m.18625 type:complete len:84 (+) Transcript_9977:2-253(+)